MRYRFPTDVPGLWRYVAIVAFASTAYIGAFTAGALAAPQLTGERATSGLPNAIGIASTAAAASVLSYLMARRGRRAGLRAGFGMGVVGGLLALISVIAGSLPLLLVGSVALGLANGAIQLTRYAASDTVSEGRRAAIIGTVVWGSTAGAVLGPNLLGPAGALADLLSLDRLVGAFALTVVGMLGAFAIATTMPILPPPTRTQTDAPSASRRELLRQGHVQVALLGMVTVQAVMVLLMTMTPLHVQESGHDIGTVGLVISAHTLGMFALSPLSAAIVGRVGPYATLLGGFAVLALAGTLAALAPPDGIPILTLALFLLGFGWSLGFVAGSSLLARGASSADRITLQGTTDTISWTAAAIASLSAGALLDVVGYATLGVISAALLVAPAIAVVLLRGHAAPDARPA
ncbi:MAG: MFS transporter [Chloroflexota bacterium]